MTLRLHMVLILLGSALLQGTAYAQTRAPRRVPAPEVYLSWNAPFGETRAARNIVVDCADTTGSDTLYLALRSTRNVLPLLSLTGTLLFEPEAGTSPGSFWYLERGGANGGNLLVDFDLIGSEHCVSPWKTYVAGHVGYAHVGGRGRLDMTADVTLEKVFNLNPPDCYIFGRVTIRRQRGNLDGCRLPMRISWVGGKLRSSRPGSELLTFAQGPNQSVTWNAPRQGVACRRTRLAIETWVPYMAPPSRTAMPIYQPSGAGSPESK